MQCAQHPKVETALTCTRCATPICPDCMVAGVAGIAAGTLAGVLLQQLGFWVCFIAPLVGGFLGEVVLRCTGHKRGKKVLFLTGLSVISGAGLSLLITGSWQWYLRSPVSAAFFLVAIALTLGTALGKIRSL